MEKRKKVRRRTLSLNDRVKVIQMAQTVKKKQELAKHFGCNRKQIRSILQQSDKLLKEWQNTDDPEKLQRRPSSDAEAVKKLVAEWVRRAKIAQIPLTDEVIIQRSFLAKKFFRYYGFQTNAVWLERFKRRFGFNEIEVESPNPPKPLESMPECLKLNNIFHDIKDTLEPSIVEVTLERQEEEEYQQFLREERQVDEDLVTMINSGDADLSMVHSEVEEMEPEVSCPDEDVEVSCHSPIKSDLQALECVRVLEEYSMLKDNYRAIGLIMQLEKLFKGQIDS